MCIEHLNSGGLDTKVKGSRPRIVFDIPNETPGNGVETKTIMVAGEGLPPILKTVTIDGTTIDNTHTIVINGRKAFGARVGLQIEAANVVVKGFTVTHFDTGLLSKGKRSRIFGVKALGNDVGIQLDGRNSAVGSSSLKEAGRVWASANLYGVKVNAPDCILSNVHAGIDESNELLSKPNSKAGIHIGSNGARTKVGDPAAGRFGRVVSSGNAGPGLIINAGHVIVSNMYAGIAADGISPLPNLDDGIVIMHADVSVGSPTHGVDGLVVSSGNIGNGLKSIGEKTHIANVHVGVDASGTGSIANGKAGIELAFGASENGALLEASESTVGSPEDGVHGRVLSSGNDEGGLRIMVHSCQVANCFVGTDVSGLMALPNKGFGILVAATADKSSKGRYVAIEHAATIGTKHDHGIVVASGNLKTGIDVWASLVTIKNTYAGVGVDGQKVLPNRIGIVVRKQARFCKVGESVDNADAVGPYFAAGIPLFDGIGVGTVGQPRNLRVVASGNHNHGLLIQARDTALRNIHAGVDAMGLSAPNGEHGLTIEASATGATIAHAILSDNGGSGLAASADGIVISKSLVGLTSARDPTTKQQHLLMRAGNSKFGVELIRATEAMHGGKLGSVRNINLHLKATAVGGNLFEGIYPKNNQTNWWLAGSNVETNDGTKEASHVYAKNVPLVGNEYADSVCDRCVCTSHTSEARGRRRRREAYYGDTHNAYRLNTDVLKFYQKYHSIHQGDISRRGSAAGSVRERSSDKDLTGGSGDGSGGSSSGADERDEPEGEYEVNGWQVDCDNMLELVGGKATFNMIEDEGALDDRKHSVSRRARAVGASRVIIPRGFSWDYNQNLPLVAIKMVRVGLVELPWDEMNTVASNLSVLDISWNKHLNPLPPGSRFLNRAFPKLNALFLRGTDLSQLQNDTFSELRDHLEAIDLSEPAVAPDPSVQVDFGGFLLLRAMLWYNNRCPKGFFATSSVSASEKSGLCARCAIGTTQLKIGQVGIDSCMPCPSGFEDADSDPTTECTKPKQFLVREYRRYSLLTNGSYIDTDVPTLMDRNATPPHADGGVLVVGTEAVLRFAPVEVLSSTMGEKLEDVSFTAVFSGSGFLVDPATGFIQGTPIVTTSKGNEFTIRRIAKNRKNEQHVFEIIRLDVRDKDVVFERNGPNRTDCQFKEQRVDEVQFDESFTCACAVDGQRNPEYNSAASTSTSNSPTLPEGQYWEGDNCFALNTVQFDVDQANSKAALAKDTQQTNTLYILAGVLGGTVLIVIVSVQVNRYNKYQESMKGTDFDRLLKAMVASGEIESKEDAEARARTPREIKRKALTLVEVIGNGQFGEVWKGMLDEGHSGHHGQYNYPPPPTHPPTHTHVCR